MIYGAIFVIFTVVARNMCINLLNHFHFVNSACVAKLVHFDIILVLLILSGKVTTLLRCGGNFFIDLRAIYF